MNGCALRLALRKRLKVIRKWPIVNVSRSLIKEERTCKQYAATLNSRRVKNKIAQRNLSI